MCLRQEVREDENPRACQGGNRGISFGGIEKGCSSGISGKCRRKIFGGCEKKRSRKTEERTRTKKLEY